MIAVWLFVHFRNDQTLRYRMHGKAQDAVVACSFWGGWVNGRRFAFGARASLGIVGGI